MPITPYNQAINYEYKPLNLSAFAKPLSEMQEKFDITTAAVESSEFDLSHLPYGTDPEKAKELIKTVKEKRDELAKNLADTKNYKQAAIKLRELNNLWAKDPELNALQSNYKLWQERDKEEKERVSKGDITRDQYLQWKNDEIRKYEDNKGASFKADYLNPKGEYNKITGNVGRLKDLDKEFRDTQLEIAKMQPEKVSTFFRQNVPSMTESELVSLEGTIKSKDAGEIARETEKYLRRIPKFKDWGQEVAKYNYYDATGYGKDLEKTGSELVGNTIQSLDKEIAQRSKDKNFKGSEAHKELLDMKSAYEEMKNTGNYDPEVVQHLYTQKHLNELYGSEDVANILAYKNVMNNHSIRRNAEWEAARRAADNPFKEANGSWIGANEDKTLTIPGIHSEIAKNKSSLRQYVTGANNINNGIVRKVVAADKNWSDIGGMHERQKIISDAIMKGQNYDQFKKTLKSNNVMKNVSDEDIRNLYNTFASKPGQPNYNLQALNKAIESGTEDYGNYVNNKDNLHNIQKNIQENSPEFKTFAKELGSNIPKGSMGDFTMPYTSPNYGKAFKRFNAQSYTPEQLKKAGIDVSKLDWVNAVEPGNHNKTTNFPVLSFDQVAKLTGHKNAVEASFKGYGFEGVQLVDNANWENGKYSKGTFGTSGSFGDIINKGMQNVLSTGNIVQEMSYRLNDSPSVGKSLKDQFPTLQDVLKNGSMKGQPGFDESGNPMEGTEIDYSNGKMPKLEFHGNKAYVAVPLKTTDKPGGIMVAVPVRGMQNMERVYKDIVANNYGDDYASKTTRNSVYNSVFELKNPGNNINQIKADNLVTNSKTPTLKVGTINNVPTGSGTFELVKKYVGEDIPDVYQWRDANTGQYIKETYNDVRSAREVMGEAIADF
jgi:hypothetical protein